MGSPVAWAVFDEQADGYDAWYDTPGGAAMFSLEVETLRPLLEGLPRPWLEVGAGSGRFGAALGVQVGVDPARTPLALAARRGVAVIQGVAEQLPFPDGSCGAVIFVLALSFVADPMAALREARRVLAPDGAVIIGEAPHASPLGRQYRALGAGGHPYYRNARFFTPDQLAGLLRGSGLQTDRVRSSRLERPNGSERPSPPRAGLHPDANFAAVRARPR